MQNIRAVTHQDKESEESFSLVSLATVHFCFVLVVEGLITVRYLHSRSRKVPMVVRDNYRQDDQKEWCLTCAEATNQRCYIPRAMLASHQSWRIICCRSANGGFKIIADIPLRVPFNKRCAKRMFPRMENSDSKSTITAITIPT